MSSEIRRLDWKSLADAAGQMKRPFHAGYFAMYSSVFGGIVTDPALMLVPVDDHVVHRGDGVFETLKCVDGNIYNLAAHLARLRTSAEKLGMAMPLPEAELTGVLAETVRAGGRRDAQLRVLVSRGPGGLGVNPYECPRPELYVVAAALKPPFMKEHPAGASVAVSRVPVKPAFFARIKSCNYLPNVLMKKEAVDAGVDFVVSFDEQGLLAEGATENVAIATADGEVRVPRPDHILTGTTMTRVLELAQDLVRDGRLSGVRSCDITRTDVESAAELLIIGTTPDVTAAVTFEGRPVGSGRPGPVQQALAQALAEDILHNRARQTPVFD